MYGVQRKYFAGSQSRWGNPISDQNCCWAAYGDQTGAEVWWFLVLQQEFEEKNQKPIILLTFFPQVFRICSVWEKLGFGAGSRSRTPWNVFPHHLMRHSLRSQHQGCLFPNRDILFLNSCIQFGAPSLTSHGPTYEIRFVGTSRAASSVRRGQ